MRRYFAGYSLLTDYLIQEAERGGTLQATEIQALLASIAGLFDGLIAAVAEEFAKASRVRTKSAAEHRAEQVRRLLAGELIETERLGYELDAWHLGAIASGPGAETAIRELSAQLDRRTLTAGCEQGAVWVWWGGREELGSGEIASLASPESWPAEALLAIGEPARGLDGWRHSHRQASAAMAVAQRGAERVLRYADVALLASALRDELLSRSLREIYLEPLEGGPDRGAALRETLAAYFSASHRASSAAVALGVSRQTVNARLRDAERRIGRPLEGCAADLQIALRLSRVFPASQARGTN